jgi:hypothetical protein
VQVELADGVLVIRGETKAESETKAKQYFRAERSVGTFYRQLTLPLQPDADQIQASMTDGVLEVRISRPAEMKPELQRSRSPESVRRTRRVPGSRQYLRRECQPGDAVPSSWNARFVPEHSRVTSVGKEL